MASSRSYDHGVTRDDSSSSSSNNKKLFDEREYHGCCQQMGIFLFLQSWRRGGE
jgi:hypothetical protein